MNDVEAENEGNVQAALVDRCVLYTVDGFWIGDEEERSGVALGGSCFRVRCVWRELEVLHHLTGLFFDGHPLKELGDALIDLSVSELCVGDWRRKNYEQNGKLGEKPGAFHMRDRIGGRGREV